MLNQKGQIELFLPVILIILFSVFLIGGLFPKGPSPVPPDALTATACCDTGNGPNCRPVPGRTTSFNGKGYGLLKSDVMMYEEFAGHVIPATPSVYTSDSNHQIFLNNSQTGFCEVGIDCLWDRGRDPDKVGIPNDMLIYACKENCEDIPNAVFDAYIDLTYENNIPDVITRCSLPPEPEITRDVVFETPVPTEPQSSLQLNAIVGRTRIRAPWVSPHCKPAIYLYPEEKTDVHVQVAPKGRVTLTIPAYPESGWDVTAYPDGKIESGNTSYDYLYYESEIPDSLIEKPKEGFVVRHEELTTLLNDMLPKLGLNKKEKSQFSDYWLKALPKSPYYFVGVISTANLNSFSPIIINPSPNTIIRVTLYFELLEEFKNVKAPAIVPVNRNGFTAVEWGGIVKTDPNQPFSCLM